MFSTLRMMHWKDVIIDRLESPYLDQLSISIFHDREKDYWLKNMVMPDNF
jgi:hypothetical protein